MSRVGGNEAYCYVRYDDLYFPGTDFWMNILSQNSGYHEDELKSCLIRGCCSKNVVLVYYNV